MNKWTLAIGAFIIVLVAALVLVMLPPKANAPSTNTPVDNTDTTNNNGDGTASMADLIVVDSPTTGAKVASPLTATGMARGTWYFEASFPVEILDESGTVVGQGHAEAQSDWMTEDFVPFTATITFTPQPAGSSGTLVLKNDNPSGDPARDKKIEIPVTF